VRVRVRVRVRVHVRVADPTACRPLITHTGGCPYPLPLPRVSKDHLATYGIVKERTSSGVGAIGRGALILPCSACITAIRAAFLLCAPQCILPPSNYRCVCNPSPIQWQGWLPSAPPPLLEQAANIHTQLPWGACCCGVSLSLPLSLFPPLPFGTRRPARMQTTMKDRWTSRPSSGQDGSVSSTGTIL
jgi:hypothetical protein